MTWEPKNKLDDEDVDVSDDDDKDDDKGKKSRIWLYECFVRVPRIIYTCISYIYIHP